MNLDLNQLEANLEMATEDQERLEAMLVLLEAYQDSEYVEGWKLAMEAMGLANHLNHRLGIAKAHHGLANCLWKLSEYSESLDHFEQSLDKYLGLGDLHSVAKCYCGMGIVCGTLEEHQTSLDYFEEGLSAARRSNSTQLAATIVGNIGHVYFNLGRYDDAMNCFEHGFDYYKDVDDNIGAGNMLGGMAGIYVYRGEHDKGIELARRALQLFKRANHVRGIAIAIMNVGIAYQKMGKLANAKKELKSALNYSRSVNYKLAEHDTLKNLSEVCSELEEAEEAAEYLRLYIQSQKEEKRLAVKRKNEQFKQRQMIREMQVSK